MTIKQVRELLRNSRACYSLWICRKNIEQNYCTNHGKHHKYWLYPTIEINPRPWWGFDSKEEMIKFVVAEFGKKTL